MDFLTWGPPPVAQMILRLLLSMIFFISSTHKIRQPQQFVATIASYDLLPKAWHKSLAFIIICTEATVSILLFLGWQSRTVAAVCIFMLMIFSYAIGINLIRGRTDLDCGCFGSKHSGKFNLKLIGRNFILLLTAVYVILWGGGSFALDNYPLIWERLWTAEMLLPFTLICAGSGLLYLLIRQLYSLLLLMPLEE